MKTTVVLSILTVGLAVSALATDRFSALPVTFSATATVNNPNTKTSGGVTTYPAPTTVKMTNKTLLALIAADEHSAGNYIPKTFPSGAQLVFMVDDDNFSKSYFIVTDSKGKLILDVSDLFSVTIGNDVVMSGKRNNANGALTGFLYQGLVDFSFDDTGIGGSTYFDLVGIDQENISDAKKGYSYVETETDTIDPAQGSGEIGGNAAVFSGSFSASGSNVFSL